MALTNYSAYKWLIDLLDEYADQKYGMTMKKINYAYERDYKKIYNFKVTKSARTREGIHDTKKVFLKHSTEETTLTYKTFINWRNAIWKEFGLIIWHPVVKQITEDRKTGVKKEKEVVMNSYLILNRELLDENRTLRATIEHLVEDEHRGYVSKSPFTTSSRGRKPIETGLKQQTGMMGFIGAGGNDVSYGNPQLGYQDMEEPEMVGIIQFAMTVGEALLVNYGKVLTKEEAAYWNYKDGEYFVLEPQQLKCINGRWYVAGDFYQPGDKDKSRVVFLDVDRVRLWEGAEDVEIPTYTLKEGFDMSDFLPSDWNQQFDSDKVVSLYLYVRGSMFENTPFCPAQEKIEEGAGYIIYKVYVKPDSDFFIQIMSYGEEVSIRNLYHKFEPTPTDITPDQISYLRDLRKIRL